MTSKIKIFISYARKDGRELALRLQHDLTDFGFEVWLDTNEIQAGANWARDIEHAIDTCHIALTLLSQGSFESEICRAEHQRAIEKKRRIVPILVMPCDRPLILQTLNFRDFSNLGAYSQNLAQLHTDLRNPDSDKAPPVRYPFNDAPTLPHEFVPRPEEFDKLKNALLSDKTDRHVALTALRGLGGIGKSIMANAICHDPFLAGAFPDGVFWVEIGREPSEILEKLRKIGIRLGDSDKNYISLTEAISSFRNIIQHKSALIVIDDVWEQTIGIANYFISTSAQSRFLVTTRQQIVIEKLRATPIELGVMKPEQALQLISRYAKRDDPKFPIVAQTLGYHPLALRIVGANLQKGLCDKWLKDYEITRIRLGMGSHDRDDNLVACFDVSVENLAPDIEPAVYHALGIFPEDMWIPAPTVYRLWGALNTALTETDCDDILNELDNLSLIERQQDADGIRMHDLLHDYNRYKLNTDKKYISTHEQFIGALGDKYALPDDYAWRTIGYHLIEAGQKATLRGLIFDYAFLDAKLHATDPNAIIADCDLLGDDTAVTLVGDAIRLSAHVITDQKDNFALQLTGRLWQRRDQIADLWQTAMNQTTPFTWAENLPNLPLDQAGGALKRILSHPSVVLCVAYSPDGKFLATGSSDNTARIWDVRTGETTVILTGHTDYVRSVAWD
ncbi:MAG: TIR domain-containing protein, partial [bacterium]|nr:TIR domain-containing protein [bacterium]